MRKRSSGFTLVEIMIVVAIIGILIAIAVPGFIRARTTSQGRACAENLQKIDGAKEQWALEEKKDTGDTPADTDLFGVNEFVRTQPTCPSGGTYTIAAVGTPPSCSLSDSAGMHALP